MGLDLLEKRAAFPGEGLSRLPSSDLQNAAEERVERKDGCAIKAVKTVPASRKPKGYTWWTFKECG